MTDRTTPSTTPTRVLFLAHYFPKPTNPLIGTWALDQANAMVRAGLDVRVASFTSWVPRILAVSSGARAYASCPPVHRWEALQAHYPRWLYYPVGAPKRWSVRRPLPQMRLAWASARRSLLELVREHRPDLIYAHHTLPNGYLAYRLNEELGLPYVITDHSFEYIKACEQHPQRRRLFERITANAGAVVAVGERMGADLRGLFPRATVRVIHNGSDLPDEATLARPRPAILNGKTVVFSAGMFYERKGFPLLIRSFARVADRHPSAILRIAGGGANAAEVEAAARASGLGDRLQLLGYQPHDRIVQEMAWCDVFALVGWDEPFGVVFSEAMSAGKPIVCANDGGINDVMRDGVHGLSVPPQDLDAAAAALDRLLSSPEERQWMGRAACELVRSRLTWDANAQAMIQLFREVLSGGTAAASNGTHAPQH
jgi:glycosyltransferase involved in cell wall biosynthesis